MERVFTITLMKSDSEGEIMSFLTDADASVRLVKATYDEDAEPRWSTGDPILVWQSDTFDTTSTPSAEETNGELVYISEARIWRGYIPENNADDIYNLSANGHYYVQMKETGESTWVSIPGYDPVYIAVGPELKPSVKAVMNQRWDTVAKFLVYANIVASLKNVTVEDLVSQLGIDANLANMVAAYISTSYMATDQIAKFIKEEDFTTEGGA